MNKAFINWLRASSHPVRTSLWAIPGLMFLAGIGLAARMLQLDRGGMAPGRIRWH